jgi:hypothetical protein
MHALLPKLRQRFPDIRFVAGEQFCWSPLTHEVLYKKTGPQDEQTGWSLLHETAHALLEHQSYQADFELVRLEVAAWHKARQLAADFDLEISDNYIEDCLDTYRDWLYKRSICPVCTTKCLQLSDYSHYRCFNCHTVWRVTPSRFCRSYRATEKVTQTPPLFI